MMPLLRQSALALASVVAFVASRPGARPDRRVETVQLAPDTLALAFGDAGVLTARCFNQHGTEVGCAGGVRWTVRDTTVAGPIRTTAASAQVTGRHTGSTWAIARAGVGVDSAKLVGTSSAPAPVTPPLPESVFVQLTPDTARADSGSTATLIARTYADAGHTSQTLGRPLSVSSLGPATASVAPAYGVSPLSLTATGLASGTTRLVAVPGYGIRDTAVVVVRSVVDTTLPPDTTSTPPLIACADTARPILPGENWQAAVNATGTNAMFCPRAGIHRFAAAVSPKAGQRFVGEPGAIVSGAVILSSWTSDGAGRWFASSTAGGTIDTDARCDAQHPRCQYREDLYRNDSLLVHVASLGAVTAGTFYFDYAGDRVYVGANPAGQRLELAVASRAFGGTAANVRLAHLTIEKFASPYNQGAIYGLGRAGWKYDSLVGRWNHSAAISIGGAGSAVHGGTYVRNGQYGIHGYGGVDDTIAAVIDTNNTAGFDQSWAAGGLKVTAMTRLVLRHSTLRRNIGHAAWFDIQNVGSIIDTNLIADNAKRAVFIEVGGSAIIRGNTLERNGLVGCTVPLRCGGVGVVNSSEVEVVGNTLIGNRDGITGVEDSRTDQPSAHLVNLYVHDNQVNCSQQVAGGLIQTVGDPSYYTAKNNRWVNNDYQLCGKLSPFYWNGAAKSWSQWVTAGLDAGGSATP